MQERLVKGLGLICSFSVDGDVCWMMSLQLCFLMFNNGFYKYTFCNDFGVCCDFFFFFGVTIYYL